MNDRWEKAKSRHDRQEKYNNKYENEALAEVERKKQEIYSNKYPDLTLEQEISLDWIIDFYSREARYPLPAEVADSLLPTTERRNEPGQRIVKGLASLGYLDATAEGTKIRGITAKVRTIAVWVSFCKVFVGPLPVSGISPSEAMDLAFKIDQAGRKALQLLRVRMSKKTKDVPESVSVSSEDIRTLAAIIDEFAGRCRKELEQAAWDAGVTKEEMDSAMFNLGLAAGIDWRL